MRLGGLGFLEAALVLLLCGALVACAARLGAGAR